MKRHFRVYRFRLVALMLLGAIAISARAQEFAGRTITSIQYDPPQQPIDKRDIESAQVVQVGQPLDSNQVAATIDRLFSTGLYDDIQVDAEPSGAGVSLRFITKARRFVGHVGAEGKISDPPSRAVIITDSQLTLGAPFDPDTLNAAKDTIVQELRQNGLYDAQVGVATVDDPDTHQVTIQFSVSAGKRAKYTTPVIKGDTKLSDNTIIRATGWRIPFIHRWRQVTAALTDKGTDGVQKKYAKQNRLTASVDVTSMDYSSATHRVTPTLDINAGPKITIKAVEAKVSKGKIRQLVPVYEEGSVDNDLLAEGARNLNDYFQSKGYPDADVTFKEQPPQKDQQEIDYYITTGPRRRLVNITFTGNDYFTEETLMERMFLRKNSLVLRYGRYSNTFRKKDEQAIEALYQSNGFRDVRVTSTVETNYKGKPKDIAVTFNIDHGKQWRVASLSIEGTRTLDLSPLRDQFASIENQPYADVYIASDQNRVLDYYYSHGFLTAKFMATTSPGPNPQTVNLVYHVTEGSREFVRGVILSGLARTRPSLVYRKIDIQDGEPISMTHIDNISRRLSDLGVFANVTAALQDPDGQSRYKYVLYDFDEAARYTFNVGFGLEVGEFGSTTSNLQQAGGSKGVSPIVLFDVNRLNFLGTGQTLSLQTRYSSLEQRESLNYIVPRFLGSQNRTVTFSILYDTTQDVQTFSSRREEASVQTSQRFNRASTLLLRFAYRRVSTGNIVIPSLLIPQLLQPVRIGILSASYIQDHRDNPADAHHGYWNTVDAGLAGNFFGSQRNFARVLARNATYTSIGRNLVFARQTQIGIIKPFDRPADLSSFDAIPLPERFFGGGGVSMRGFGDNQAGPRDIGTVAEGTTAASPATGFPIGGNGLFFNTFELRFPLLGPNISGVVFHDMGNIYTNFGDISLRYHQNNDQDFNYAVQAAGFGVRYKTPLGPVRVDLSYALNPPKYMGFSGTIQQLLSCSASEIGVLPQCTSSPQQLSHVQFFFSIGQAF